MGQKQGDAAIIAEFAPAKINLTLEVLGRRPDGYHELESLVGFATVGDRLTLDPAGPAEVVLSGPFADAVEGQTSLHKALTLLAAQAPALRLGTVHLDKQLPVAAGLGGGSADAAALLRAVRRCNPDTAVDWHALALSLGSDVPVCLGARAAWMSGRGEHVATVDPGLRPLPVVIANALGAVPHDKTAAIFRRLAAPPLPNPLQRRARPAQLDGDAKSLASLMLERGNDLAAPARAVMPEMNAVLDELSSLPGVLAVAVSGAGPTCFAVFASVAAADEAVSELGRSRPGWWTRAATVS